MALTFITTLQLFAIAVTFADDDVEFIADVYSSNDIYLVWKVDNSYAQPASNIIEYRECGESEFREAPIQDITDSDPSYSSCDCRVFSTTLNNLDAATIYEVQLFPGDTSKTYQVRTVSSYDDWEFYLEHIAPFAVGAVGAIILTPTVLDAVGFGAVGITAGSVAAGAQSSIGLVEAGSVFALLQSAGMAGVSTGTVLALGLGGAGVVGGISEAWQDECGNSEIVEFAKDTFEASQQFVIEQVYEHDYDGDMSAVKQGVHHCMQKVNEKIYGKDLRQSVQSEYAETKETVKQGVEQQKEWYQRTRQG